MSERNIPSTNIVREGGTAGAEHELSEFEAQFSDSPVVDLDRFRSYIEFLGILGDRPHCFTTTTPNAGWIMFAEKSILGNPYHTHVRMFETKYDRLTHGIMSRDILFDVSNLRMSMFQLPVIGTPEFAAERIPCLTVLEDELLTITQGKSYEKMYAKALAGGLETPIDTLEAEAIVSKYAKGARFNVIHQQVFSGIDNTLQVRHLALSA